MDPLIADDICRCVRWVCSLPARVDDEIVVRPRDQATATRIAAGRRQGRRAMASRRLLLPLATARRASPAAT